MLLLLLLLVVAGPVLLLCCSCLLLCRCYVLLLSLLHLPLERHFHPLSSVLGSSGMEEGEEEEGKENSEFDLGVRGLGVWDDPTVMAAMVSCTRFEHALFLALGRQEDTHKMDEGLRRICEKQPLMAQVQDLARARRQAWMQSQNATEVVRKAGEALDIGFAGLQKAIGQYLDTHRGGAGGLGAQPYEEQHDDLSSDDGGSDDDAGSDDGAWPWTKLKRRRLDKAEKAHQSTKSLVPPHRVSNRLQEFLNSHLLAGVDDMSHKKTSLHLAIEAVKLRAEATVLV